MERDQQVAIDKVVEYRKSLPSFLHEMVTLADKAREVVPFDLNKPQQYVHKRIEDQRARTGMVRVLLLKGRQQGMTTYTQGRNLRNTTMFTRNSIFVMAHDANTTSEIFKGYKRMYDSMPNIRYIKPTKKKNNAKVLEFVETQSEINIGTAGNVEIGRGFTVHQFHGSEVAFWSHGDDILAAVFNAIPPLPGTEVILESTANGMANMYYRMCMQALKGEGDYELIFIPWWWSAEYQRIPPEDYEPDDDEWIYYDTYMAKDIPEALAPNYLYWRKMKIAEGSLKKFKQEYPATPLEAFQTSGDSFFRNEWVECAINTNLKEDPFRPLIIGVDAAEQGGDRTAICFRRGDKVLKFKVWSQMESQHDLAQIVAKIIEAHKPHKVFFDKAYGSEAVKELKRMGYGSVAKSIAFGGKALERDRFANKRAEMHVMAQEWLQSGFEDFDPDSGQGGVDIPAGIAELDGQKPHEDQSFRVDLAAIPQPKSAVKIQMESKQKIKEEFGMSPDLVDSFILTFAEPVKYTVNERQIEVTGGLNSKNIR